MNEFAPIIFALLCLAFSLILCMVITPPIRILATRCGLLDVPDGRRKLQSKPVPVAGGLAIFLSVSVTVAIAISILNHSNVRLNLDFSALFGLFLGCISICAVGVADDIGRLRGRHKLAGQAFSALVVVLFGAPVRTCQLLGWDVDLGLLAVPLTVIWLLGSINALNLIDGVDGLLGSVGVVIALAIATIAALSERWVPACIALALAGALLGFLVFNFPPASIYLGDSGSMLTGLVIGVLALQVFLNASATFVLVAGVALLAIPFFDTLAAILRRKLTGRSIYTTDRAHFHHCLLRNGLSIWGVLVSTCALCVATAIGAIASVVFEQELFAIVSVVFVVGLLVATRMFGYAEFVLLRRHVVSFVASLLRLRTNGGNRQSEIRLHGSVDWADLWTEFTHFAQGLNLRMARLSVNAPALHEDYHAIWESGRIEAENELTWHAEIPIMFQDHILGHLQAVGLCNEGPAYKQIALMMELVEKFEREASVMLVMHSEFDMDASAIGKKMSDSNTEIVTGV